ncbi:hypothetical protein E2C01_047599 [Portunus trituberculatus]|uniref:Secreted protein n=1 Tax=Portunus trituberculatus TaxID=210409 RepID=A0A5B7G1J8_PORTR|nr:hypothetical protein [Portunus trituberculatus]
MGLTVCLNLCAISATLSVQLLDVNHHGREQVPHPKTRPAKVRWCRQPWERGTSTASPPLSTVLVLRVETLIG